MNSKSFVDKTKIFFIWGTLAAIVYPLLQISTSKIFIRLIDVTISDDQPLVKLVFAIFFILVSIGISSILVAYIGAKQIEKTKNLAHLNAHIKLPLAVALTTIITVIPYLFLTVFVGYYTESPTFLGFALFFGVLGALYGLLLGTLLAIFSLRQLKFLRTVILSTLSFLLGGILSSFIFYMLSENYLLGKIRYPFLYVSVALFIIFGVAGLFFVRIYSQTKGTKNKPAPSITVPFTSKKIKIPKLSRKTKTFILFLLTIILIFTIWSNIKKLASFATIIESNVQPILTLKTNNIEFENSVLNQNSQYQKDLNEMANIPNSPDDTSQNGMPQNNTSQADTLQNQLSQTQTKQSDKLTPPVICDTSTLNKFEKVIYEERKNNQFYKPENKNKTYYLNTKPYIQPYFCGNKYLGLIYMPNPYAQILEKLGENIPEYKSIFDKKTLNGGYDKIDELITQANYEILFATMEYMPDYNQDSPGFLYAESISTLYKKVRENPSNYPEGMHIKILLGNYPEVDTLQWGSQIYNVVNDLKDAGVPTLNDKNLNWKIEIANFHGSLPHSHTKFIVIDGNTLITGGYNYSYLHYPKTHPSKKGLGLIDFGLAQKGPVAQSAISVFDDLWNNADAIKCPTYPNQKYNLPWVYLCKTYKAKPSHPKSALKAYFTKENENAFTLYRTEKFKEADIIVPKMIKQTEKTADIFEVNFSLKLKCDLEIIFKGICDYNDALPYMKALVDAISQNKVKTRIIVEKSAMNGLENRIGINIFLNELEKRGVKDKVEIRFSKNKMHSKAYLLDDEILVVGSQNFHYSSWGDGALAEFNSTTSNQNAINEFKKTFEYYWQTAIPIEELMKVE